MIPASDDAAPKTERVLEPMRMARVVVDTLPMRPLSPPALAVAAPPVPFRRDPAAAPQRRAFDGQGMLDVGERMLTVLGRVDRYLQGWRSRAVVGSAAVVVGAPFVDDSGVIAALSSVLFVGVVVVVLAARLDALKDEAGRWPSAARLAARTAAWMSDRVFRVRGVVVNDRARTVGKALAVIGVCSAAVGNIVGLVDDTFGIVDDVRWIGWMLIAIGLIAWALGAWQRRTRRSTAIRKVDMSGAEEAAVHALPPLLDCRDPGSVLRAASSIEHHHAIATVLRSLANCVAARVG